jgi:large subunit ribosomal protein L21
VGGGASSSTNHCSEQQLDWETPLLNRYTFSLVYAVIRTGGKQERVEPGQTLAVELLGVADGDEVTFDPILLVDGETVVTNRDELASAKVAARVVGEVKGRKIKGFTYKPKTRGRRAWGHRQRYTTIEITGITREG